MSTFLFSPADISIEFIEAPARINFERHAPETNVVQEYKTEIKAYRSIYEHPDLEDDDDDEYLTIGYLDYTILNSHAVYSDREDSMFEVGDAHSEELGRVCAAIFDKQLDCIKESVANSIGDCPSYPRGLLYIERLELLPDYRGHNLGLAALYALLRYGAASCDIAVLEAAPLQRRDARLTEGARRQGMKKLREHYSKIGFNHISRTSYMAFDLEYRALPVFPGIEDLH